MRDELQRLDALLVERGFVESRSRAQGLILSGSVRVGDRVVTKAGFRVAPDEPLAVARGDGFVSRAGKKLDGSLDDLGVRVEGRACLDAGASTGGFTDVLLRRGARRCWRWTWATGSSTGRSGTTSGSWSWSGPTCGISRAAISP